MNAKEQKIRKLYSMNTIKRPSFPFRFCNNLWADPLGICVTAWTTTNWGLIATARNLVFRTLCENGIPNEVVQCEPIIRMVERGKFVNGNPESKHKVGRTLVGCRELYMFCYTDVESLDWFDVDGHIYTRLSLV